MISFMSAFRFVGAVRPANAAQDIHARLRRVHAPREAPFRLLVSVGLGAVVGGYGYDFLHDFLGIAELISHQYRWRDENRKAYNVYQRDLCEGVELMQSKARPA